MTEPETLSERINRLDNELKENIDLLEKIVENLTTLTVLFDKHVRYTKVE